MMIDPANPLESYDTICYNIKSKFIHGMEFVGKYIYFIDDNFKVHILERENLQTRFNKIGELYLK